MLGFRTSSKLEHGHITLIRRRTRALPLWVSGLGRTFVSYVRFGIRAFARAPRECLHTCARLGSPRAVSAASAWVSRACIAIRWRRHHEGRAHATYARFIGCWLCSVRHIIHVFSRCPHKKKRNPQRVTQLDKSNVSGASLLTGTIEAPRVRYGSIPP